MRALVIGIAICLLATFARADDKARAKQLFDDGRELLKTEHYTEACAKFTDSLALDPATGTQLNLAECLTHVGQEARAKALFEAAAADDEVAGNMKRAAFARGRAEELAKQLAASTAARPPAPHPAPPPPIAYQRRRSRLYVALGLGIGALAVTGIGLAFTSAANFEYAQTIASGECDAQLSCSDAGIASISHSQMNGDWGLTLEVSGAVLGLAAVVTALTAPRDPVPISVAIDRNSVGFAITTRF